MPDEPYAICPAHGEPMTQLRPHGLSHARKCPRYADELAKAEAPQWEGLPELPEDALEALVVLFNFLARADSRREAAEAIS